LLDYNEKKKKTDFYGLSVLFTLPFYVSIGSDLFRVSGLVLAFVLVGVHSSLFLALPCPHQDFVGAAIGLLLAKFGFRALDFLTGGVCLFICVHQISLKLSLHE
jgi:hypothetical protein